MTAIPAPARDHSTPASEGRTSPARPPRVEIVAITTDDLLLEQIGQALDGESIIRHADSPAEAQGLASPRQPCVVLLDARGYDDLARVVADLQSTEGARVVVVFAPAEAGDEVARAVRGSATFAVLAIPVVQALAAAVLDGAREESLARHALLVAATSAPPSAGAQATPIPTPEPAQPADAHRRAHRNDHAERPPTGGPRTQLVVGAVALATLVAGALWYWLQRPDATTRPDVATPTVAPEAADVAALDDEPAPEALQTGSVDELLDAARAAMRARQYTDPEGQNALNYYRSVLAQEPDNGEAREGLERIGAVLGERVQAAVEQRRFDEAQRTLSQLRSIRADDPAIARYESTVAEARIRKAVDELDLDRARELLRQSTKSGALAPEVTQRWQSELDRQQGAARAEQLAELVSLRIRQGRLTEPANDNAKHYLAQLRRLPGDAQQRAVGATTELQQAYLGKLKDALARSQRSEAERWKTEARALGVTAAELNALQRDASARAAIVADSKQETARLVQLVQDRIAGNRLLEPAGDSAVYHLNALRTLDPTATASSERALSAKLLEQGRNALDERRLDAAKAHASAARQLGVNLDTVAAFERDIAATAGTTAAAAGSRVAPRLERTRYVAPEYPANALRQRIEGKVRVRIVVDAEGRVREAVVVQAEPAGVFDAAAVASVRRWRFKPIGEEDSGVTAIATLDIAFRPEDAKQ